MIGARSGFAALAGDDIAFDEVTGPFDDVPFVAEERYIERATPRRRAEFAAGRACARRAMAQLGVPPGPIRRGPHREPVWPSDAVVGSITHCAGFAAAAVARRGAVAAIGIDAEVHRPLSDGVIHQVTGDAERRALRGRFRQYGEHVHWECVAFSAKESVFKAWFPLTGRWLGFHDAFLEIDPASGTFRAVLLVAPALVLRRKVTCFEGRYAVSDGRVATAVVVSAEGEPWAP